MSLAFHPHAEAYVPTTKAGLRKGRRWWRAREVATTAPAPVEFTWTNRQPGTPGFSRWMAAAGERIAEHGLTACSRDVDNLVGIARRLGVAAVAADVLADPHQPEPARHRAFAHVVAALDAHPQPAA